MGTKVDLDYNGSVIRYDKDLLDQMEPRLFDADWLKANGHHQGLSAGRGQAHFLSFAGHDMVLRHFRRGGLLGKFNRDLYARAGRDVARSFQEFDLLAEMHDEGLPVPRPIAALYSPVWLFYRAAIISERIPDARPLEEVVRDSPVQSELWHKTGRAIRQMHDAGVYHSDLNCRNILVDNDKKVWLIDFDKCRRRPAGPWTGENLDRLNRSLRKENAKGDGLHWTQDDWPKLIDGYEAPNSDGAGAKH